MLEAGFKEVKVSIIPPTIDKVESVEKKKMSEIWKKTLSVIKDYLSTPSYETWFKSTKVVKEDENSLKIGVISEFARDWLRSNYLPLIKEI